MLRHSARAPEQRLMPFAHVNPEPEQIEEVAGRSFVGGVGVRTPAGVAGLSGADRFPLGVLRVGDELHGGCAHRGDAVRPRPPRGFEDAGHIQRERRFGFEPHLEQPGFRVPCVRKPDDVVHVVYGGVDSYAGAGRERLGERSADAVEPDGWQRVVSELDRDVTPLRAAEPRRGVVFEVEDAHGLLFADHGGERRTLFRGAWHA